MVVDRKNILDTSDISALISLDQYETVDYRDIKEYLLFDRVDTKYVMNRSQLSDILTRVLDDYKIVTYNGKRSSNCGNRYYDTPQFKFYLDHHNGKRLRHKVRVREYLDSGLQFLEVKSRKNEQRTLKERVSYANATAVSDSRYESLVSRAIEDRKDLQVVLSNSFNRITLVNNSSLERVTIDQGLTYNLSISKYCLGISQMYPELKSNRFKEVRRKVREINL